MADRIIATITADQMRDGGPDIVSKTTANLNAAGEIRGDANYHWRVRHDGSLDLLEDLPDGVALVSTAHPDGRRAKLFTMIDARLGVALTPAVSGLIDDLILMMDADLDPAAIETVDREFAEVPPHPDTPLPELVHRLVREAAAHGWYLGPD
jgi:hypothetical protein